MRKEFNSPRVVPGWNLENVDRGSFNNDNCGKCREGNSWFGYKSSGDRVASISTTLSGCGEGKIDFGECSGGCGTFQLYPTIVGLNGKEIGRADPGQLSKILIFEFQDGDILELGSSGTIRFNSFTVLSCCF